MFHAAFHKRCKLPSRHLFLCLQSISFISCGRFVELYSAHSLTRNTRQTLRHYTGSTRAQLDRNSYASLVRESGNSTELSRGKMVHTHIVTSGHEKDTFLGNLLIEMYGKCFSLQDACMVFDNLLQPNIFSGNIMAGAFARLGRLADAQLVLNTMPKRDIVSWNAMLTLCVRNGNLDRAETLFHEMPKHNVVSWNSMLSGYAQNGQEKKVICLFEEMQMEGVKPNKVTYVTLLDVCARMGNLEKGKSIHEGVVLNGFDSDIVVGTALVNMYGKCGCLKDAKFVFSKLVEHNMKSITASGKYESLGSAQLMSEETVIHDVFLWNAILTAYIQNDNGNGAIQLFKEMQLNFVVPDKYTYAILLDACANTASLAKGKWIHHYIIIGLLNSDIFIGNSLINMYSKCGSSKDAQSVFDKMPSWDVVSWNVMIGAYVQNGYSDIALELFQQMEPMVDRITYVTVLDACCGAQALSEGKNIHEHILCNGFQFDAFIASALINMYGKCGAVEDARMIFDNVSQKDVILWNAMLAAYSQNDNATAALHLFEKMQTSIAMPNNFTFSTILDACAGAGAIDKGKQIHNELLNKGLGDDTIIGNALLKMYGKCGNMGDANQVFCEMPYHDTISWNAMLAAHAQLGNASESFQFIRKMQLNGIKPDKVSILSLLFACSHASLVIEGCHYLASVGQNYGIGLTLLHYNCVIDLLGRAGELDEAEDLIGQMEFESMPSSWISLLGACGTYSDLKRGQHVAQCLLALEPNNASWYVALSNLYATEIVDATE